MTDPGILEVVDLRAGQVLDRVQLTGDGQLRYETGAARSIFESPRRGDPDLTDAQLFKIRVDWTNGYVAIRPDQPGGSPP